MPPAARPTAEGRRGKVREAHIVRVIDPAHERELVVVDEPVQHRVHVVPPAAAGPRKGVAEPPLLHAGLHREVDHGLRVAVIEARKHGQIALLLVGLHLVDDLGRQVFGGRLGVVREELLAVDQYLFDLLSVHRHRALSAHLHARHLLQQILKHRPFGHLVRAGAILHRVVFDLHLHGAGRHDGFSQQHPVLGHRQPTHVHGRLAARYVEPLVERVEPDVRHVQQVVALPDAHQVEVPLAVRDGALHHRAVLDVQQPHGRHLDGLRRLARSDDCALDVDLRHRSGGSPQQQEAQKKDRKSLYHRLFTYKSCVLPRRPSPESGAIDVIRGRWFKPCPGHKMLWEPPSVGRSFRKIFWEPLSIGRSYWGVRYRPLPVTRSRLGVRYEPPPVGRSRLGIRYELPSVRCSRLEVRYGPPPVGRFRRIFQ